MNTADLMGGYAAYTTPNGAIQELATTSTEAGEASPQVITWISVITMITTPVALTLL